MILARFQKNQLAFLKIPLGGSLLVLLALLEVFPEFHLAVLESPPVYLDSL